MSPHLYHHIREILPYLGLIVFGLIIVGWSCWFFGIWKERERLEIDDD